MRTMGQVIDAAIKAHELHYPESKVYAARICDSDLDPTSYRVELDATHFSEWLIYFVPKL